MNSDYRFRAWCLNDFEEPRMIYEVEHTYDYHCQGKGCLADSFGDVLDDDNYKVMQYVRCNDRNGKPIYEEDICKVNGNYYIVRFHKGTYRLLYKYNSYVLYEWLDCCEVVGNSYENPELMERVKVWEN